MDRLMVAGGGTGGHLFPGVAVAEEFIRRGETAVLFVGTGRPVEAEVLGKRGIDLKTITSAGFKGKSLAGRARSLGALPLGLIQSIRVIRDFKPDMVFGVGGYVSGPVGAAARLLGVPSAIHEQNSVPGLANRMLGRLVDMVFVSFESSRKYFPDKKTRLTGNPIRRDLTAVAGQKVTEEDIPVLLVMGGSQGAHAINLAVVETVVGLERRGLRLRVIHQTGTADLEMVRAAYDGLKTETRVEAFIDDMAEAYGRASLLICRAGALTVAETAATARPAIFIPLPTAANNHQELNARWLVEAGAGEMILQSELTAELLAEKVSALFSDRERLRAMGQKALEMARPEAAGDICDYCQAFIDKRRGGA